MLRAAALVALAALGLAAAAPTARAQAADSTAARDTTAAPDSTRAALPTPPVAPPAPAAPIRTQTRRGGPYTVVADRLEGGRTPLEGEIIVLMGNVTLSREGTVVRSQNGRYVKREGTIHLTGGVNAVDGGTRITAHEATYNEASDFLTLSGQVVVLDEDLEMRADFGSYDQAQGRAELWSRVRGRQGSRRLTADRLTYLRDAEIAQARGHVVARDSTEGLTLTGPSVDYDRRAEIALATQRPKLVQDARGGKGATTLVGDTITVRSKERVAIAEGRVEVTRDSLRAEAGRVVFFDADQRGVLTGSPRAWTDEVTVRGDTLEAFTRERGLERLRVTRAGEIEYRAREGADAGERSLLTADRIDVWLDRVDDGLDSLYAVGNAVNEYVGKPVPGRRSETNRTTGAAVRMEFAGKQVERATFTGAAAGSYRAETAADDTSAASAEAVEYGADRIVFEVPKNRIRLEQNAVLNYQEIRLRAPEVIYDLEQQVLEARGNPQLEDRGDTLKGRSLAYDLESRRGVVFGARTRYQSGWYSGDRIRRLGDDVLDVGGARYSTCNLEDPHYGFESDRMKIYLRDKLIARPVVFAIKHIPILALPFYVFPIRQDRASGLLVPQFQLGFTGSSGGYIRNAGYYWAPNEYTDFTLSGDWYPQRPLWILRGEARYRLLYKLDGQVQGSIARESGLLERRSWDLNGYHQQVINDRTSLTARANFTSSGDYTRDPLTGLPLANRIDRLRSSNLSLTHNRSGLNLNLALRRDEDLDKTGLTSVPRQFLSESLPELSISMPQRPLGRAAGANGTGGSRAFLASTYVGVSARLVNLHTVSSFLRDSAVVDTSISRQAYRQTVTLSDNRRLGFVTVGPSFTWNQVVYGRDALGKSLSTGGTWSTGAGARFTLYGTSRGGVGPLLAVRHAFSPQLSYTYQPAFPRLRVSIPTSDSTFVLGDRFPAFGSIGLSSSEASFLSFNVSNTIEAKVRTREGSKTLTNLLSVNVGSGFDFLHAKKTRGTPWQPIQTSIRVQPPNYVSADATLQHDPARGKWLRQASGTLSFRFAGGGRAPALAEIPLAGNEAQTRRSADPLVPWSLSVSVSSGGGRDFLETWSHRESANLVARIQPTANWTVDYINQVDLNERKVVAQEWTVGRSLHCWNMQFVRRFSGGAADYYFRIGIVDRPEIFVERGTSGIGTVGGLGSLGGVGSYLVP